MILLRFEVLPTHKEGDENRRVHQNQGQNGRPAVAKTVGDGSGQKDTDKSATLPGLEESTLPLGWDGRVAVNQHAVLPLESGQGDEVAVQEHVKGFHDLMCVSCCSVPTQMAMDSTHNGETHDEGPQTRPGMALGGRPQAHLMLTVFAVEGIIQELRIGQDFGVMNVNPVALVRLLLCLDDVRRHFG